MVTHVKHARAREVRNASLNPRSMDLFLYRLPGPSREMPIQQMGKYTMPILGCGQKVGEIIQMAYTVKNIRSAMDWWVHHGRVGPWFLLESFTGPQQRYRGAPTTADVSIAMAFSGHMMIELIQPKDDQPSVYKEIIDRRGYGFHHLGLAVNDVESERAAYERRHFQVAFQTPVPTGGTVYYMDDGLNEPGFIELIPATSGMDALFTRYWRAAADWKGEDPVRPFG